ncbi:hypothetical protein SARC_07913 [Sphaeroforma arctica JP610]|uniref:Uncharacterized protein n=1 Tax=Sphaeroforma arctica JP610 TaxID=667725 RepID=A0A0L0FSC9_9EUKA|nr:hypothetical protein SARC_07913 [Sphaeroforma arctica JP610]KNC79702.1 hypothetical protein SARC_07913 [Sphaeroforma arctica JP610]|eukprot:XP_014153604.1 hypothetical protein SARC_07913 [Sphaeroforma arctica JP610]
MEPAESKHVRQTTTTTQMQLNSLRTGVRQSRTVSISVDRQQDTVSTQERDIPVVAASINAEELGDTRDNAGSALRRKAVPLQVDPRPVLLACPTRKL